MALSLSDHKAMLAGFSSLGFACREEPTTAANPIQIEWHVEGKVLRYRLWAFEITHGGGGPTVRAPDEFRIHGPHSRADIGKGGAQDLLVGYSSDRDVIVAYDRNWLENWIDNTALGKRSSPSAQVKEAEIQAGQREGIHHLVKNAKFGEGHIVTISPALLPTYLLNNKAVLQGTMSAIEAQAATPKLTGLISCPYLRIPRLAAGGRPSIGLNFSLRHCPKIGPASRCWQRSGSVLI